LSPLLSSHDICGVCKWEDDPIQNNDPDYSGGANHISLNEAKQAFAEGKALRPLKKAAIQRWQPHLKMTKWNIQFPHGSRPSYKRREEA
jgi:hypothetical protein